MAIGIGSVLGGKYLVDASIGRGGMGEVYAARDLEGEGEVAIKVVRRQGDDALMMARLQREAEASARIVSPYVPTLFDVAMTEEGELFLVMERLHGESLAERLHQTRGLLAWEEVARIGEDVLVGLADAHAAGVVHRDLKPGNIFLETSDIQGVGERAKILDFGVCKLDQNDGEALTTTGEAIGTVSYMAPEQIRGASKVDERADLYAFAMVMYECLSGRLAYEASGQIAMIASKLEKSARNLREVARVPVPPGLDGLLAKCLARAPSGRFASADAVLVAWRGLGAPTVQPRDGVEGETVMEHQLADAPSRGFGVADLPFVSRGSSRIGFAVAAALFASSFVILMAIGRDRGPSARGAAVTSLGEPAAASPTAVEAPLYEAAPTARGAAGPDAGARQVDTDGRRKPGGASPAALTR